MLAWMPGSHAHHEDPAATVNEASQLYMTPPYSDASLTVAAGSSWCACDPGIQASMFCSLPRARTGTKHEHPCAQ